MCVRIDMYVAHACAVPVWVPVWVSLGRPGPDPGTPAGCHPGPDLPVRRQQHNTNNTINTNTTKKL